jgi:hypothetical protein
VDQSKTAQSGQSTSLDVIKNQDGTPKSWGQLTHEEQQRYGSQESYGKVLDRYNENRSGGGTTPSIEGSGG